MASTRPQRTSRPTAKLIDANNAAEPETNTHREAIERQMHVPPRESASAGPSGTNRGPQHDTNKDPGDVHPKNAQKQVPDAISSPKHKVTMMEIEDEDAPRPSRVTIPSRSTAAESSAGESEGTDSDSEGSESGGHAGEKRKKTSTKKKTKKRRKVDGSGSTTADLEKGIEMVDIDAPAPVRKEDKGRDINHFFGDTYGRQDGKRVRDCSKCSSQITSEISTLRRHMQAHHEGAYRAWCKANNFASMLPRDRLAQKQSKAASKETQSRLDGHLKPLPPQEVVVPYTDELFNEAARDWLIETNQPISALQHPLFHKMIHIAARATNGVKIADLRNTRDGIKRAFKQQMTALRTKLNSQVVKGAVNLTCDAWQADTADGYFAVTGHWIEANPADPDRWEQQSALLGFVRMNCSHSGRHLGLALFKVTERLKISHKVGFVTCDNATNNDTMMMHFADHLFASTGRAYCGKSYRVRCLAHIINLATQALLETYSKSPHYDPTKPDADLIATAGGRRDVVGLIRSIAVKARSSAQRKQLFLNIQSDAGIAHPKRLLMDMPVRWSSTYTMLHRAEELREHVDTFVSEMARAEKDKRKRRKLDDLQLTSDEWTRVKQCLDLLAHADNAQQAFSSDRGPSLHLALPALEALQRAWISRASKSKYAEFSSALEAGCSKIKDYYEKTAEAQVYTFALLLNPESKAQFVSKSWGKELLADVLAQAEETYKERYLEMYPESTAPRASGRRWAGSSRKLGTLLREVSDDESSGDEDSNGAASDADEDAGKPWRADFQGYLRSRDSLGTLTIVEWWGRNAHHYPVWASLARDFLSVMAASVSSERAFSAAGITIDKRRNRLNADIVEALQCLKSLLYQQLLFPELPSSLVEEGNLAAGADTDEDYQASGLVNGSQVTTSWDAELLEGSSDVEDAELPGAEDEEVLVSSLD